MPAKDLGNKFICFKCSTRFYDLKKPQPLCPKCGADQRDVPVVKASRRIKEKQPVVVAPEVEEPAEDEEDSEPADEVEEEEPEDDL
jgi:uncharacterized protein (TIGR02300 family)